MRGVWRLKQLGNRHLPKAIILLYHRVADTTLDPQLLSVGPQHFAEHLEVIRRDYHPISLTNLVKRMRWGNIPSRSVVVTFDDGYADNLFNAKPLLEQCALPSTVFVAAGYVGTNLRHYWDELARVFLLSPKLPSRLSITVADQKYSWEFENDIGSSAGWNVLQPSVTNRQHAYAVLCDRLRTATVGLREATMKEIFDWAGTRPDASDDTRALSMKELHDLAANGLMEVGAHTMTHPALAALPQLEQQKEIVQSKRMLEDTLNKPVSTFAYPYGGRDHYTAQTAQLVTEAKFHCACSNFPSSVQFWTDQYQLPRHLVRDWDGEQFSRYLAEWFA